MRVLVIGAGGHGQVVADMLRAAARAGEPIEIAGYLDDRVEDEPFAKPTRSAGGRCSAP